MDHPFFVNYYLFLKVQNTPLMTTPFSVYQTGVISTTDPSPVAVIKPIEVDLGSRVAVVEQHTQVQPIETRDESVQVSEDVEVFDYNQDDFFDSGDTDYKDPFAHLVGGDSGFDWFQDVSSDGLFELFDY